MKINVLFFARLREFFNREGMTLELPEGTTVTQALEILCGKGRDPKKIFSSTLFAINQEYVRGSAPLKEGDQLFLIPPVAGG